MTTITDLDSVVRAAAGASARWAQTGPAERADLIDQTITTTLAASDDWVRCALEAKKSQGIRAVAAEEWLGGPAVTLRALRLMARTLRALEAGTLAELVGQTQPAPGGLLRVRAFPAGGYDALTFPGFSAEVWARPGTDGALSLASTYRPLTDRGSALVLGAGNITSIAATDALHQLFVESRPVIVKTSPVLASIAPVLTSALAPLIQAGVLAIVSGDADAGRYLATHPLISAIHVTGSEGTFDALRQMLSGGTKSGDLTAELGNVTPVIVVPGRWRTSELYRQAVNIATMLANNGGYNCVAARVIVTCRSWPQRHEFLDALAAAFDICTPRAPYYPGAESRHARVIGAHPESLLFGGGVPDTLPWALTVGVDPTADDVCFAEESFAPTIAETALDTDADATAFLPAAVAFANDRVAGTLAATIIAPPRTVRGAGAAALEQAIADLDYGTVTINHWAGLSFALGTTPWGASPGAPLPGSGVDSVHNALLIDSPVKSVVRGPFHPWPRPAWWADHPDPEPVARGYAHFQAKPRLAALPRLIFDSVLP
jgi:acyl-CoA reductase-like NAD-dependent aldehyde dehydrogenase